MRTTTKSVYPALATLALAYFALSPRAHAGGGPPPNCNTSDGFNALFSITTGVGDTALGGGKHSLATQVATTTRLLVAEHFETTLLTETQLLVPRHCTTTQAASGTTAVGRQALFSNTGDENTAVGYLALHHNTDGVENTAVGSRALFSNKGSFSPAAGLGNTAVGDGALYHLNGTDFGTASVNTAIGYNALIGNTTGSFNTAVGKSAGEFITGDNNIAIGNVGAGGEVNTIRIGAQSGSQDIPAHTRAFVAGIRGVATDNDDAIPVVIDSAGQLGTTSSSARFKAEIKPMDKASEPVLALKPTTFRWKDKAKGRPQFGLIAEDVEKVSPDLVIRDSDGKPYTVRYDAVNAMLLNEFLKEHRKVEQLEKQVDTLTAGLQRVSAQLELSKPAPQTVANNQ